MFKHRIYKDKRYEIKKTTMFIPCFLIFLDVCLCTSSEDENHKPKTGAL